MYTRLLQGYDAMDPDMKASSAFAANKLRLMVNKSKNLFFRLDFHAFLCKCHT